MKKTILLLFLLNTISLRNSYPQSAWFQQNSGTSNRINDIYALDANNCFAAADSGVFLKTTNGGTNWFQINTGITNSVLRVRFLDLNNGIIVSFNGIYKTTNSGNNWFLIYDSLGIFDVHIVSNNIWFFKAGHVVVKTTDQGQSWTYFNLNGSIYGGAIFFIDEFTGWTCGATVSNPQSWFLSKTTNGGSNWTTQYSFMGQNPAGVMYDIYFGSINNGVCVMRIYNQPDRVRTINSGNNWILDTLSVQQYSVFFISNLTGWTCGDGGIVMKTTNGGSNWVTVQTVTTNPLRSIHFINDNTGWASGDAGTIIKTTTGGATFITPISNNVPEKFSLSQNYPNPFNPNTTIKFYVAQITKLCSIVIYDVLGREVETLVNEKLNPGTYEVEWNAKDYPSGVYFYKLRASDYIETKKMVLVK